MKRMSAFKCEIIGSVMAWPVEIDLSRDKRGGRWTIYFRYADPDHPRSEKVQADNIEMFLSILEENHVDCAEFAAALVALDHAELIELAKQIEGALANRKQD